MIKVAKHPITIRCYFEGKPLYTTHIPLNTSLHPTPPTNNFQPYILGVILLGPFPATASQILPAVFSTKDLWCLELALQQQLSFCQGFLQRHLFWQEVQACAQHLLARCMHIYPATRFDSTAASAQLPPLLSSGLSPASP